MVFWSNDLEMTSLAYGLLLGAVGAILTCFGLSFWASIRNTARNARELLRAEGSGEVQAKILGKEITPKAVELPNNPQQNVGMTRTFYLVSYVFDAVRSDGVTCRVEVRQRKVPSFVWGGLKEGATVPVRYLFEEPRRCRIVQAAEHEKRGFLAMRLRASVAALLVATGVVAAVLAALDHHIGGVILYLAIVLVSAAWQLVGRSLLRFLCPCLRRCLQDRWSPLFMHAGYVFCRELGKDVVPCSEPEPIVPKDVEIFSVVV